MYWVLLKDGQAHSCSTRKAKEALDKFYAREDTLSLGVCNGCQLMMELNLINPELKKKGKMLHNNSHKFESRFLWSYYPD